MLLIKKMNKINKYNYYEKLHKSRFIKNLSPRFESFALCKTYVKDVKYINEFIEEIVLIDPWAVINAILMYIEFKIYEKALCIELPNIDIEHILTNNIKYKDFPFGNNLYKHFNKNLNSNLEIISNKVFNIYVLNNNTIVITEKEYIIENINNNIDYVGTSFAPIRIIKPTSLRCYKVGTIMYKGKLSSLWRYDISSDIVNLKYNDMIF